MEIVEPENLAEWRAWLEANHETSEEIWLALKKGGKGAPLSMKDAVDEALCSAGSTAGQNAWMVLDICSV